jgi:hypothetical protein
VSSSHNHNNKGQSNFFSLIPQLKMAKKMAKKSVDVDMDMDNDTDFIST